MDPAAAAIDIEVENQLAHLQAIEPVAQGRALALLTVLFSRCTDQHVPAIAAAVPGIAQLLESSDETIQANACAALSAAAAVNDQVASIVAAQCTQQLVDLLQSSSAQARPDAQLNVVSALGQLARDQQVTAEAVVNSPALTSLLSLADKLQPVKLQEAVADALCALASHEWAGGQLHSAGIVSAAAGLLNVQQLEVSVRCLMVLGMLLPSNAAAQQQLADNAAALQQLMQLLKQSQDFDCKIVARDILGVLMKVEGLQGKVKAAVRLQTQQAANSR